ncbi:helix-turn-helix domain-containing protein [Paenibacillus barengoltzii]|uniref:helix-turn-helix domain-containing protein n=1 Tax=Paenibacillus barengoltzii TaxID=343517 RepID=UPI002DBC5585|nr:helix-turn-helix domain-containing protein [Paenibacillus barengoltzii]MEC2343641.1 helix-turn-helix domain-containing protein [Paenibacillus barengoltzii]
MLNERLVLDQQAITTWMSDRLLRYLVSGSAEAKVDLKECLTRLQLNPYYTFPTIALLEPSTPADHDYDKLAYLETIRKSLQEQMPRSSIAFLAGDGRIGLLFSWVSKEVLGRLQAVLREQYEHPVYIGVGKPCSHLRDIHLSYRQAAWALQSKFYSGSGQLMYYGELRRLEPINRYPAKEEQQLYDRFRAANSEEEITEAVEGFYSAVLEKGPIDIKSMYELTIRMLVGMERRVQADEQNVGAYSPFEATSLVKLSTLEELKRYVSQFLTRLWKVASPGLKEREHHRSIIKKSIHYMEQECQHASLQSVAQKVYMTPTYLSLLFKTNTGKTFIEHLTDIRIDKAKEMLRTTHYKNYEVAEKVGYQDPRYFSQIFKKKVGVSPSEYRESVSK